MTVKFKVIKNDGEVKTIKRNLKNFNFVGSNVNDAMEHLDNFDKVDFMDKNDIHIILNYKIIQDTKAVTVKIPFAQYAINNLQGWSDKNIGNFFLIYKELKSNIFHLTNDQKFKIVLNAFDIALTAKIAVYDDLERHKQSIKALSMEQLKQLSTHYEAKD